MTAPVATALDAAERVVAVCDVLAEMTSSGFEDFLGDTRTQWAVEMGLIRIGEGVNRIPAEVLDGFSGQPWRQIVAMRNFAAHQYDLSSQDGCGAPSPGTCPRCATTWCGR